MVNEIIEKPTFILKVRYLNITTGELSLRDYTYLSEESLGLGDHVRVPVRDTTAEAVVSSVNVPEAEIAAFKDKVKIIPAGSIMVRPAPEIPVLADAAIKAGAEVTETKIEYIPITNETKDTPGTDLDVINWNAEGLKLLEYARVRAIQSTEDMKTATDDLSIIAGLKKAMETRRQEYVKPLNDQVKSINEKYKELMAPVLEADNITRKKMTDYRVDQERLRKEQEEINRLREDAARKEAALNGGEISEPLNLVEVVPEAPRKVITDMGTAGERANWTYEITDFSLLPDEYKLPNTAALNAFVKSTKGTRQVPGLKIFNQPIIAVRAR